MTQRNEVPPASYHTMEICKDIHEPRTHHSELITINVDANQWPVWGRGSISHPFSHCSPYVVTVFRNPIFIVERSSVLTSIVTKWLCIWVIIDSLSHLFSFIHRRLWQLHLRPRHVNALKAWWLMKRTTSEKKNVWLTFKIRCATPSHQSIHLS